MSAWGSLADRRIAGAMLILGALLFFIGVSLYSTLQNQQGRYVVQLSPEEKLPVVAANPERWRSGTVLLISGVAATALGLAAFTATLRDAGDRALSQLGMASSLFAAVLLVISLAFSGTVTLLVAQETAAGAAVPTFLVPLELWGGMLFWIYMMFAYLSIASYGGAVLRTGVLPKWIGWLAIIWSGAWLGVDLVTGAGIPAVQYIMPPLMGILLLTRRDQATIARTDK